MIGGERLWVPVSAVHGMGVDAVTINAEAGALTPANAPEAVALVKAKRGVIGSKVLTETGEQLGEVRDFEFDPLTFALTSLSVPPAVNAVGEILTIAGDQVLTIGEDMIVVAADAVTRLGVMGVAR
jgi:sporulation protein YlmC with PRC-barrel domain